MALRPKQRLWSCVCRRPSTAPRALACKSPTRRKIGRACLFRGSPMNKPPRQVNPPLRLRSPDHMARKSPHEVSTTCVSGWIHHSMLRHDFLLLECLIHPLTQVVLTSFCYASV